MLKVIFIIPLFLILSSALFAQPEGDRIIAVVGKEIITESDFQYQLQLYARQNQLADISPYMVQQIFQSILTNKIILAKADQDSIFISEEELNRELENRIKNLIGQVGSAEKLEEMYSMSMTKIKILLKEDLEKSMKTEKLKRQKFAGGMRVSDAEVKEFYTSYGDSLPDVSEELEIAAIIMERKVSESEKKEAERIALQILDSIKNGTEFSDLARRNSADSLSAIEGGDLGIASKGTFVKEFEDAVFSLSPGEVSGIVETQFGLHIIKSNEKLGDKVKAQHILIRFPKFESSDFETLNFLNDLRDKINKGEITFEDAAKQYSDDPQAKSNGGYAGKVPAEQFDSATVEILNNLTDGQISEPIRIGSDTEYGYQIIKVISKIPPHKLTLKDDYEKVKRYAENYKENKEMESWIEELRESIYVDIKM
ncbi:MAG TPA: peptidylprolyl isomerase [Ignavibacteria bacterium]|nr:peptidylprolyl isomerase [Ignavibacteria bacterium]HQY52443.1 peptidylprolyl isomerase [Ignavibacteria bacterium]